MRRSLGTAPVLGVGILLVAAVVLLSVATGYLDVPFSTVLGDLACSLGLRSEHSQHAVVIQNLRLPRAIGGACVGAALGAAGCMLQALLRNPIASPVVLGTAQASGFGAMLAISFGFGHAGTLAGAFAMSLVALVMVLGLSRTRFSLPVESVVVVGMAFGMLFTALSRLLQQLTRDEYVLGRMMLWAGGGLWHTTWSQLLVFAPVCLLAIGTVLLRARNLDLLALGEADAHRLGLAVKRNGIFTLVLACVLTSAAICIGGMVAFVGLIVPHAARWIVGPMHRALLPASTALGAVLVVLADMLARTIAPPQELPLTVMTSLIGVPFFLVILRSLRAKRAR
jgi:iron complex transport system permease protein